MFSGIDFDTILHHNDVDVYISKSLIITVFKDICEIIFNNDVVNINDINSIKDTIRDNPNLNFIIKSDYTCIVFNEYFDNLNFINRYNIQKYIDIIYNIDVEKIINLNTKLPFMNITFEKIITSKLPNISNIICQINLNNISNYYICCAKLSNNTYKYNLRRYTSHKLVF